MMKQRIWVAVFFVVGYFVMHLLTTHQRDAEEQAQEAILREPIVLTEGGFTVNGKEVRFGMSEAEVFAILGAPTGSIESEGYPLGNAHVYGGRFLLIFRNEYFAPQATFYLESFLFSSDSKAPIKLGDMTFYPSEEYTKVVARLDRMAIAGATIEQTEEETTWRRGEDILKLHADRRGAVCRVSYQNDLLPTFPPMQLELLPDGFSLDGNLLTFGISSDVVEARLGAPHRLNDRGDSTYFHTVDLRFREEQSGLTLDAINLLLPVQRGVRVCLLGEEFSLKDDWLAIQATLQAIDDPMFHLDTEEANLLTVRWYNALLTLKNHQHIISMNYQWQN